MCQASGDTAVGMTEPAPLPSRQVRKTDTHRETNTVSSIKLVSAKRSQQQQMHSGVLDAWRGPGDFSEDLVKSAHQTYKHLWNRLSGRRNSKCKGPEANCVLLVFYVCTLALPFENGDHHYKTIYLCPNHGIQSVPTCSTLQTTQGGTST